MMLKKEEDEGDESSGLKPEKLQSAEGILGKRTGWNKLHYSRSDVWRRDRAVIIRQREEVTCAHNVEDKAWNVQPLMAS